MRNYQQTVSGSDLCKGLNWFKIDSWSEHILYILYGPSCFRTIRTRSQLGGSCRRWDTLGVLGSESSLICMFIGKWIEMFYLNSTLNIGMPPVLVFQLEVFYKIYRLLIGLTNQSTNQWINRVYLEWLPAVKNLYVSLANLARTQLWMLPSILLESETLWIRALYKKVNSDNVLDRQCY